MFGKRRKQTVPELEQQIRQEGLSLSGLDIPDFSKIDWSKPPVWPPAPLSFEGKVFYEMTREERDEQAINGAVLAGDRVAFSGVSYYSRAQWDAMLDKRMHELYGSQYDELRRHPFDDVRVKELLLQEAMKTGRWKVLPQRLWREYYSRMGMEYPC